MAKSIRDKIKLVSSADTGHYYTTAKGRTAFTHHVVALQSILGQNT